MYVNTYIRGGAPRSEPSFRDWWWPIVQTIIVKLQLCSWMYQRESTALKVFPKRKQIQIAMIEIDGKWLKAKKPMELSSRLNASHKNSLKKNISWLEIIGFMVLISKLLDWLIDWVTRSSIIGHCILSIGRLSIEIRAKGLCFFCFISKTVQKTDKNWARRIRIKDMRAAGHWNWDWDWDWGLTTTIRRPVGNSKRFVTKICSITFHLTQTQELQVGQNERKSEWERPKVMCGLLNTRTRHRPKMNEKVNQIEGKSTKGYSFYIIIFGIT